MRKDFERSSSGLAPETSFYDRVDLERSAEHARDLRARYVGQLITCTIRDIVGTTRADAMNRFESADLRAIVTLWAALLALSRRRAYRG